MKRKVVFGIILIILYTSLSFSQTKSNGTIKVQKSTCLDFTLTLALTENRDTITISEINKSFAFRLELTDCSENLQATIESYDISINQQTPLHFTKVIVPYYTFKVKNEGILTVTNCIVRIDKPDRKQKRIVLPTATFYIISDNYIQD